MIDVNKTFELLPPLSTLSQSFHREVIEQVYRRSAKPFLDAIKLRAKDTWSNHVYGELMPALLDKMFQRAGLNRSSLFLDLGSGVGTVVAQAALGTGCSAVGIEISPGPSSIATTLLEQAEARGRVWGLNAGSMLVERGDMFESETVSVAVSSADMVLLNNRAFNEESECAKTSIT
jgi:H3 lysine-79-specific histone-lysine N-methyltransferase